jgi:uncharacterized membrane protein HdeD (DUF308 family)
MVNEPASPRKLAGWLPMAIGILFVVVGAVWALQGLNVLTDSVMSDNKTWALVGPIMVLVGLILIIVGVRHRARSKRQQK